MQIGDKVTRFPETFYDISVNQQRGTRHPMTGTVAYIHPNGRYHMVEFETPGGVIRECFVGVEN